MIFYEKKSIENKSLNFLNNSLYHLFNTKKNYYLYDSLSGEILKINEIVHKILSTYSGKSNLKKIKLNSELLKEYSNSSLKIGIDYIKKLKKSEGIFKKYPENSHLTFFRKDLQRKQKYHQLVLEVTKQCNLRCSYCTANDNYKFENRYENNKMQYNTAIKAIDYFKKNYENKSIPVVSFFGGEPFLEFDFIKKCVIYSIKKFKKVSFFIQTNGYLIEKKDIINFLIQNNIRISVSIDGPQKIHDRCRVTVLGEGTYHKILSNLKKIYNASEEYFINNVSIQYTIPSSYFIEDLINYHNKHPFLKKCKMTIYPINRIGLKNSKTIQSISKLNNIYFLPGAYLKPAFNRFLKGLKKNDLSNLAFENKLFTNDLITIHTRRSFSKNQCIAGFCQIGKIRLYVSCDGDFIICERTNTMPAIGNVNNGINWRKIKLFKSQLMKKLKQCNYCWSLLLCDLCWTKVFGKQKIDDKIINDHCENIRVANHGFLKLYASITEEESNLSHSILDQLVVQKKVTSDP